MPKEIVSRLDDIERRIRAREPVDKFDAFWMARRLRQYEEQLIKVAAAIEHVIPGVGALDPLDVGKSAELYLYTLDQILKLEQQHKIIYGSKR